MTSSYRRTVSSITATNRRGLAALFAAAIVGVVAMPAVQVSALSGSDFNPGNIINGAVFTNSSSMSPGDIQNFLNAKVTCDTYGAASKSYYFNASTGRLGNSADSWVTSSRAVYGQRYNAFHNTSVATAPYICLKDYVENPTTRVNNLHNPSAAVSGGISAAQIIYNAGQAHQINPQVLIVLLQKEQGLVTDDWPWANQYEIATGYACPDTGSCDAEFFGFANQVSTAAKQFRRYMTTPTSFNYTVGNNYILYNPSSACGGTTVNITNQSTAALYNYTPYQPNASALQNLSSASAGGTGDNCGAYGNRNFWWYFTTWFGSTQTTIPYSWTMSSSVAYADSGRTIAYSPSPALAISPGGSAYLTLQARNNGYQTWSQSNLRLGSVRPTNRPSQFSGAGWLNNTRIAMQQSSVAPGDAATFTFALTAPATTGSYTECFNVVVEGITWMPNSDVCYNIDVVASQESNDQNIALTSGQSITTGNYLMSASAHSVLLMQTDGNLVLYGDSAPQWHTGTNRTSANRLIMQTDGNLVLYNQAGTPLWNSGTAGNPNAQTILQSDGNLVVYSSGGAPLWSSATNRVPSYSNSVLHALKGGTLYPQQSLQMANRSRTLIMQRDGNLVLYSNGQPVWASFTQGNPGAFMTMQSDGNLVVYSKDFRPLWATYTNNNPGSTVVLQDDGNIVIYNAGGAPVWHSRTFGR